MGLWIQRHALLQTETLSFTYPNVLINPMNQNFEQGYCPLHIAKFQIETQNDSKELNGWVNQ